MFPVSGWVFPPRGPTHYLLLTTHSFGASPNCGCLDSLNMVVTIDQFARELDERRSAMIVLWLAVYVFCAICLMAIAKKLGSNEAWMAWIPVLNFYLMCRLAGRPGWWLVLYFVPGVNVVIIILVWMKICELRGRPNWWVVLLFIPIVNIVILILLAFQEAAAAAAPPASPPSF